MALQILSVVFCGLWVYAVIYMRWSASRIPQLRDVADGASPDSRPWPLLSIVVPACNEAEHIEAALKSLLAQDYPSVELVVVDDRSTDETGRIIDRIAAADDRVRAVHVETLPDGWLGKVHAMHQGVQSASGEWYLFTDADVVFAPDALRIAVEYARRAEIEHLTCTPEIEEPASFLLDVAIRAFVLLFSVSARLAGVNRSDSKRPVGIGAFNLVRATAFELTPGFEWLRMETADDLGLGMMLKAAGAQTRLLHGEGKLRLAWYGSMREMVRGLEKNGFGPGASYSYPKQLVLVLVLWLFAAMPGLSFALGLLRTDPISIAAGGAAVLATAVVAFTMPRESKHSALAYLLLPVGVLLLSVILLRAAILCLRNGGIDWRGTHYSVAELRAGQRVRL